MLQKWQSVISEYFTYKFKVKDLSRVKTGFISVPLQSYFEIAGLASAEKWQKIQNMDREESFQSWLLPC